MVQKVVRDELLDIMGEDDREFILSLLAGEERIEKLVVRVAKDARIYSRLEGILYSLPTHHTLYRGDARNLWMLADASVHLVLTSPPYWTLKEYRYVDGQLGVIEDYRVFLSELKKSLTECYRVLVPGGRLVVVVGDVALSRKRHGRHVVVPLHADIQLMARELGFENLSPIIWSKISNVSREMQGNGFLGKPYQPNAIVKLDFEYILMFRKPGYRTVGPVARLLSVIPERQFKEWLTSIWNIRGESTKSHPAPFPLELAERIVRLFSFAGDTVLDPFAGTGTTMVAAARWGRNSVGVEIDPEYVRIAQRRFLKDTASLFNRARLRVFLGPDNQMETI